MTCQDLTVFVCSYNNGEYISGSFNSIISQELQPGQIVIIDDASTDNSLSIIQKFKKQYPKFVILEHKSNQGMLNTFNETVAISRTKYMCKLDADDFLDQTYFSKAVPLMEAKESIGVVYTDMEFVGPRAKIAYYSSDEEYWFDSNNYILKFPEYGAEAKEKLLSSNFIHNASLCRTEAMKKAGGYKKTADRAIDHDLFIRILNQGYTAIHIPEPLLHYRQHSKTQFNNKATNTSLTIEEEEMRALENKAHDLAARLNQVKSSKFYKLWRRYCALKERFLSNKNNGSSSDEHS